MSDSGEKPDTSHGEPPSSSTDTTINNNNNPQHHVDRDITSTVSSTTIGDPSSSLSGNPSATTSLRTPNNNDRDVAGSSTSRVPTATVEITTSDGDKIVESGGGGASRNDGGEDGEGGGGASDNIDDDNDEDDDDDDEDDGEGDGVHHEATDATHGGQSSVPGNQQSRDETSDFDKEMAGVLGDPNADEAVLSEMSEALLYLTERSEYARRNEQQLVKKCRDLSVELTANNNKVQAALRLSQADRSTIASMKKELKKAWKLVETGNEKDSRSKDAIARLKIEVDTVKRSGGAGGAGGRGGDTDGASSGGDSHAMPGLGGGITKKLEVQLQQEAIIKRLNKDKEDMAHQYELAQADIKVLKNEVTDLNSKIDQFGHEKAHYEEEMTALKDLLGSKKADQDRDAKAREKLEQILRAANDTINKRDMELATKATEVLKLKEAVLKMESQLKEERSRHEKEAKERDTLLSKIQRLQSDFDEQFSVANKLRSENRDQAELLKKREDELDNFKAEMKSSGRAKDVLQKRLKTLETSQEDSKTEMDTLQGLTHSLAHENDAIKTQLDEALKLVEHITRERDIAQKNFVKATGATQKQLNVVKLADQTKRTLEQEILQYKEEASKMRKLIYALEKDRDRNVNEVTKIEHELNLKEEDIKLKEMMIFDSRKKISDLERKLKEQQSLYENVRADRNLYSKNLIESQDEITEMKRKIKIMSHQIEQLKEEISNKEQDLAKEHFEHQKLDKEKEGLSSQIGKLQIQYEEAIQTIQNRQAEENKLRRIISEADTERIKLKKDYDGVVQERDILGTQLIRRNDELSLLYEKIRIQMSTLNKGEIQYRERVEDIRVLKLEIKKLRRERAILQNETQNVDGLRNEIFRLQREVLKERTRVKVLEEELENPMNIHRWRKLSGSDPTTFELITKIQTLQKRLISKTEEVVEKELIIAQKEKLYREVKEVLQRQPGPEIVEELRIVKDAVKAKMRECKSLASELNMYHAQINEYKYEIERLNHDLQDIKKKYFEQKRRDREDRKMRQKLEEQRGHGVVTDTPYRTDKTHTSHYYAASNNATTHGYPNSQVSGATSKYPHNHPQPQNGQTISGFPALRPNPPAGPKFQGGGFNMSSTINQRGSTVPDMNDMSAPRPDTAALMAEEAMAAIVAANAIEPGEDIAVANQVEVS
ncbi:hypothetical protein HDU76_000416 [Blyttiomyces sp. JEL0837]|nr:hypothetical protein HDU76_000416 [Blyttiomyces sp. JEL0837]